jgi:diguanylate cyclase (GGDEF)-like protein
MISIPRTGAVIRFAGNLLGSLRSWQVWDLRGPLRCYVLAVPVVYAGAFAFAATTTAWQLRQVLVFAALLACGVAVTEANRSVREPQGTLARDLQSVWYLAIAITLPPWYALAAPIPLAVHKLYRTRRMLIYRRIFSHAAIGLAYGLASVTFHSLPAAVGMSPGTGRHALYWVLAVAACGMIGTLVNYGFILVAIRLSDPGARIRDLVGSRESLTSDVLELSLAVALALVVAINPVLMALALPTVVLCRRYLMQAQLLAQTRIDAKTGLLNAGTWQREAAAEFYRARRSDAPLALVMVDIDHFNSVNETAGLAAGDQVLQDIARAVTQNLQGPGLVGRFGGEQFAILLPQTGETEARQMAERLRDHIAGEPIAIEDGNHAGFVFRLTVSIGIAILDRSRRALAELIGAADTALSEAKTTGRNRVCVVPGVVEPGVDPPAGFQPGAASL